MSLTNGSARSRWRIGPVVLLILLGLLTASGAAFAEPPFRIPSQITDRNGSLGCSDASVNNALATLRSQDSVQLWVVFTDTFSDSPAGPGRARRRRSRVSARTRSCWRWRPGTGPTDPRPAPDSRCRRHGWTRLRSPASSRR